MDHRPPNPASSPRRGALDSGLLRATPARDPGRVSVLEFGTLLPPRGAFNRWLSPRIWPAIVASTRRVLTTGGAYRLSSR
jgi:hypothetical protein